MNKQKYAFTLVELIVVITILAILWTIAFISLQWYSKDARDSIRISDVSNMKTSLELFHLNSWKYPLPDDNQIADYWTEILWYQWDFWTSVISSLSRSISEVPTDPLTDKKYVFSVANNKNEFEILSLLEWDSVVLNNISQTNAASLEVTPKIDWTYNRVFIKTASYIVPVPSIINTEVWATTMTLDSSNISSQVINWGENIPEQWNIVSNTWALTWLVLSVYIWSVNIDSSNSIKEDVMLKIQDAYTGSILWNNDVYEYILSKTWTEILAKLTNSIVLKDNITDIESSPPKTVADCGTWIWTSAWDIIYWTSDWTDVWLVCGNDIIICNWTAWSWTTIAACNQWAISISTGFNDINWYGWLYQWWNNFDFRWGQYITSDAYPTFTTTRPVVSATWSTYSDWTFIKITSDWQSSPINTDLWWQIPWWVLDMKWPCDVWYHVPSNTEWTWLHTLWLWGNNGVDSWMNMSNDLKMPMAGYRTGNTYIGAVATVGNYWASWTTGINSYDMYFTATNVYPASSTYRAYGFSVRCFKN